jgi:hypothetical protein
MNTEALKTYTTSLLTDLAILSAGVAGGDLFGLLYGKSSKPIYVLIVAIGVTVGGLLFGKKRS